MLTLAQPCSLEAEIKRSFIARAAQTETREEAMAFVASASEPKATHNCWAYKIGQDYRFSDDGEPGGTAAECLRVAGKLEVRPRVTALLTAPFSLTGAVYPVLNAHGAEKLEETYSETGLVLRISIEQAALEASRAALADATRGQATLAKDDVPSVEEKP